MKIILSTLILFICTSYQSYIKQNPLESTNAIDVLIDITDVISDRVLVVVNPGRFNQDTVYYRLPKIVQGTYEISDYGKFIDDLQALDYQGQKLALQQTDANTWVIPNARALDKITYLVNDTYDVDASQTTTPGFPSGTNIDSEIFVLNLQGFIGYFNDMTEVPYNIHITAPAGLKSVTPFQKTKSKKADHQKAVVDSYMASRYFDVTDKPVIYGALDVEEFKVGDVAVTLGVYSPTGKHQALDLKSGLERMMTAQKAYLGNLSNTDAYGIYIYLTKESTEGERKYGALEHTTSTLAVFPEETTQEELLESSVDIIAHEFFHTVTPLSIHSEKIHFFDYSTPDFSKHIWFYEGVTEYFSEHFKVQQKLLSEQEYLDKVGKQVFVSRHFNDSLSFTELSEHIIEPPYASNFVNVYFKGPLIALCVDLLIRDESKGKRNLLSLMKELSVKYGKDKYFEDDSFIEEVSDMTYPSVGEFLTTHVVTGYPINYSQYFNKVGLKMVEQDSNKVVLEKLTDPTLNQSFLLNDWLTQ